MDENIRIQNKDRIEIIILEEELGIESSATLDGKMINDISELNKDFPHDVLPIEEIFQEMVKQINYEGEGLLPKKAKVNFSITNEEGEVYINSQMLGEPINKMYEEGVNGMTWIFDQITQD